MEYPTDKQVLDVRQLLLATANPVTAAEELSTLIAKFVDVPVLELLLAYHDLVPLLAPNAWDDGLRVLETARQIVMLVTETYVSDVDAVTALACIAETDAKGAYAIAQDVFRLVRNWAPLAGRSPECGALTIVIYETLFGPSQYTASDYVAETLNRAVSTPRPEVFKLARVLSESWSGTLTSLVETARTL
jgi:hypothetical protein